MARKRPGSISPKKLTRPLGGDGKLAGSRATPTQLNPAKRLPELSNQGALPTTLLGSLGIGHFLECAAEQSALQFGGFGNFKEPLTPGHAYQTGQTPCFSSHHAAAEFCQPIVAAAPD